MSDLQESGNDRIVLNDCCLEVMEKFYYLSYTTGAREGAVASVLARIKIV